MKLEIELSDYVEKELEARYGQNEKAKAEFVSAFVAWKEADMTNWSGLPHCESCGEEIDDSAGYPGVKGAYGEWYHIDCNGVSEDGGEIEDEEYNRIDCPNCKTKKSARVIEVDVPLNLYQCTECYDTFHADDEESEDE